VSVDGLVRVGNALDPRQPLVPVAHHADVAVDQHVLPRPDAGVADGAQGLLERAEHDRVLGRHRLPHERRPPGQRAEGIVAEAEFPHGLGVLHHAVLAEAGAAGMVAAVLDGGGGVGDEVADAETRDLGADLDDLADGLVAEDDGIALADVAQGAVDVLQVGAVAEPTGGDPHQALVVAHPGHGQLDELQPPHVRDGHGPHRPRIAHPRSPAVRTGYGSPAPSVSPLPSRIKRRRRGLIRSVRSGIIDMSIGQVHFQGGQ